MSIFLAVLAAISILAIGFLLGIMLPRWVRWDLRSATMLAIWGVAIVLSGTAFWVIV